MVQPTGRQVQRDLGPHLTPGCGDATAAGVQALYTLLPEGQHASQVVLLEMVVPTRQQDEALKLPFQISLCGVPQRFQGVVALMVEAVVEEGDAAGERVACSQGQRREGRQLPTAAQAHQGAPGAPGGSRAPAGGPGFRRVRPGGQVGFPGCDRVVVAQGAQHPGRMPQQLGLGNALWVSLPQGRCTQDRGPDQNLAGLRIAQSGFHAGLEEALDLQGKLRLALPEGGAVAIVAHGSTNSRRTNPPRSFSSTPAQRQPGMRPFSTFRGSPCPWSRSERATSPRY